MKKITFLLFVMLALCVGYVAAQDYPQPENQQASEPQATTELNRQMQNVTGVVDKIDLEKKMITVKDSVTNEKKVFTFDAASSFTKENQPFTAADLKKGEKVSLAVDSQNMITTLKVEPKESTPEK